MNKRVAIMARHFLAIGMAFLLITGSAWAYTFDDNTLVQQYKGATYSNPSTWIDVVGSPDKFNTHGADLVGDILTIYTNWYPGKGDINGDGRLDVFTADLFIDASADGDFDYAIRLTGTGNNVFVNPIYSTSIDLMSGSSFFYGGKYDDAYVNPSYIPVRATSSAAYIAQVKWTGNVDSINNKVAIPLSGLNLSDDWYFVWGTATCGNDTFSGKVSVPEPASLLLLGIGLLGIAGIRRKQGR
jgi:hypothetical protein